MPENLNLSTVDLSAIPLLYNSYTLSTTFQVGEKMPYAYIGKGYSKKQLWSALYICQDCVDLACQLITL